MSISWDSFPRPRSAQVAGELFNRVEAVSEAGDRLSIPFQLPIGQIPDVQV